MRRETNLFVQPSKGFSVPCEETELSTRIDVVPTYKYVSWYFASFTYHRLLE
jgi:hypothetical protein